VGSIVDRKRGGAHVRRYVVYREQDGRQKWWATPKGTSVAQARLLLAKAEANVAEGRAGFTPKPKPDEVKARRMTLSELVDRFTAEYASARIKDIARYRADARSSLGTHVKLHRIAACPAVDVTTQSLRDWRDELLAERDEDEPRGPAAETVKRCLALLSRLYVWANDRGLVDCPNPVSKVEKPVNHSADGFDFLSQEEVAALLAWAGKHQPTELPLYMTAVYTGMRLGELAGLRWIDVDLEGGKIHVKRSYRTTPKSGKARTLPLNPHLAPVLRTWKESCPPTDEGLVFPAPTPAQRGKLTLEQVLAVRARALSGASRAQIARDFRVSWNAVQKILDGGAGTSAARRARGGMRSKDGDDAFHAALLGAGVRRVRFHDLRHTFASHFVMSGGGILALQKLLGHHSVRTTEKYAHLAPDFLAAEAGRVSFLPVTRKAGKVVALAERS
jgi:integrase